MICASMTENDLPLLRHAEKFSDLIEMRIDLIGRGWENIAKKCSLPWIACDRSGGIDVKKVSSLGAAMVDVDISQKKMAGKIKGEGMECIVSFHDYNATPPAARLEKICREQIAAGADVCKIVTTANNVRDNIVPLEIITKFKKKRIVSFCMGQKGVASRILCPLIGGAFTYASSRKGKESAAGQIPAEELRKIYNTLKG